MGKQKGTLIGQQFEANESPPLKISDSTTPVQARDQKPNRLASELKAAMCQSEMQWYFDLIPNNLAKSILVTSSCSLLQKIYQIF